MSGAAATVIKLTDLAGRPMWLKPGSVTAVHQPHVDDNDLCHTVVWQGSVRHQVKETPQQVMGALGQV